MITARSERKGRERTQKSRRSNRTFKILDPTTSFGHASVSQARERVAKCTSPVVIKVLVVEDCLSCNLTSKLVEKSLR
jgi:hypothetical protein